jgi:hypothetical protein
MLRQVFDLPPESDLAPTELAVIYDPRPDGPIAKLHYPQINPGAPEGIALVKLRSGHYIEIIEYGTTFMKDVYIAVRIGPISDVSILLEEFLRAADLTDSNLRWTELEGTASHF